MKKIKRKEHLKKLMFVQHIIIIAITCIAIGLLIKSTSAREEPGLVRDTNNYIDNTFRDQTPTTGDVFDALYSGTTAYTKKMSGYESSCIKELINFIIITGSNENIQVLPQIITENTIYILNGGKFAVIDKTFLSGNCIAILGNGDVDFLGMIDFTNTKYSIIDNIYYHNNRVGLQKYTTTPSTNIYLENSSNTNMYYSITGDINTELTGKITGTDNENYAIILENINNENEIDTLFYETYNIINHTKNTIIHDDISPIITGTKLGVSIENNGLYNTGIRIQIFDTNLSGIFNEALFLSGGIDYYDSTFPIEGIYNIIAKDWAGNQTGISFEIDTTPPSITNLQPASGSTYTNTSLKLSRQINENTTRIQSQKYYLYSGTILITSGEVIAGNTGVTLINVDKGIYNRKIEIQDKAGNISTGSIPRFTFNKLNSIFTGTTAYILGNTGYTNENPTILFSGNKSFDYSIYTGTTGATHFIESGNYTNLDIGQTITKTINRNNGNTGNLKVYLGYKTQDNEIGTGIFNFYIDKTVPSLSLNPLGGRRNSTGNIVYSRSNINKSNWMIKHYTFSMNNNIVYSGTNTSYTQTGIQVNNQYRAQVCAYDIAGNVGCSPVQTIVIDQTSPQIHNITNSGYYKNIPNPAPIIVDESGEPIYNITVKRNGIITLETGHQISPYVVNLQGGEALYQIIASDEAGNSTQVNFIIDTTLPTINLTSPLSGKIITGNSTVIFSWTGYDGYFSGYEFTLSGDSYGAFFTGFFTTNTNKTITNLNNGTYERQVTIFDKAGNKTKSPIFPLILEVPLTGQISLGGVINVANVNYTKTGNITLETNINNITKATITGNIVGPNNLAIINEQILAGNRSTPITLTPGEGQKNIYIEFEDPVGAKIYSQQTVIFDTTPPSKPNLTNINNQNYTGSIVLTRPESTDDGAGVKEYIYTIQQGTTTIKSGTGTNPSITIENMELGLQGTFTIKVQAIDYIGNNSNRSESAMFNYTGIPDTSPEQFTFSRQTDVERDTIYRSNSIVISGLSTHTLVTASIDEGTLFVNGANINKQSLVKNGDVLYIELRSSEEYYEVTTSTLTIADQAAVFKLITEKSSDYDDEDDDFDLSVNEIIELEGLYLLIENLDNNLKKTLKDMMEEKIDELEEEGASAKEIAKLRYIYDRLVEDINNNQDYIYTAPNGKKYSVAYKAGLGYSSINFSVSNQTKYFASKKDIEEFIDKNNPGNSLNYTVDNSRSTSPYKAPNGKIYNLFKTTTGKFGSYNMVVPKLFDTLKILQDHINKNNPKK
ncbi:MAG: hypothetical protein PHR61_02670 [Candidatus Absconditabacteria bacterium]|nr:hypothetical protein [Candidatus Absconditabacteria bacterium]